jgi:hypothetical protein
MRSFKWSKVGSVKMPNLKKRTDQDEEMGKIPP